MLSFRVRVMDRVKDMVNIRCSVGVELGDLLGLCL
jgi:hypothetical protein